MNSTTLSDSSRREVAAARCATLVFGVLLCFGLVARLRDGGPVDSTPPPRYRVSLATAGEGELATLPGVGPVLAARIVAERDAHGICRLADLRRVRGIGDAVLSGLAPYVEED